MTLNPPSAALLPPEQSRQQFLRTCMAAFTVHMSHIQQGEHQDKAVSDYLAECQSIVDLLHGVYQTGDALDLTDVQLDRINLVLRHTRGKLMLKPITSGPADFLQALDLQHLGYALAHIKATFAGPCRPLTGGVQA